MSSEKIVTLFDNAKHAEEAKNNLLKAGFSTYDISLIDNNQLKSAKILSHQHDIWQRLFGNSLTEEESKVYAKAVKTGGVILSLRTNEEEDTARAMAILNDHQCIENMSANTSSCMKNNNQSTKKYKDLQLKDAECQFSEPNYDQSMSTTTDDILPLAEEQLEIGKKIVKEGFTRVRRFVTKKDVEIEVPLHEEHAAIFRRSINKNQCPDQLDWSDSVVEITETSEQPVINKTAHIVEEIIVRKEGKDRIQKIHDTVRKQEVKIEHNNKFSDKEKCE
ncbi:MAG: YsnF/AvaK domain-containing protein [Candidatus Dasytiphilus stammeri]